MKLFSSKRRWIVAAVVVLLLFLFRPGASRLKSRIIASISSAVGRSVDIGSVHLRLLPRPGFDLQNLVVYDDPAFGAEPMLQAGDVTAALRLTSLVRGRLEIARLDLTEPSLNLVHGENGRWNVEALLERTARTPLAPTAKAKSEPRPAFPYIEATSARINFKNGPEKKPYALTNADFSLWQDSENAWGVRLRAQPVRTDLNLNDTGVVRVNGNWQRAATFHDTPFVFTVEWSRAQLGQITKLFTGSDQGWRGGIQLDATLTGTPANLSVTSDASIDDFRRYDITSGQALRLAAHCTGRYELLDHAFHALDCAAPVGAGLITLQGDAGLPGSRNYGLELKAENVLASAAVALAERMKNNLPADLTAGGMLRGSLQFHEHGNTKFQFQAKGEISQLRLSSAASKSEIGPETVPFVLTSGKDSDNRALRQAFSKSTTGLRVPPGPRLEFGPVGADSERGSATAQGFANRSGYGVLVRGNADVGKALRAARMLGIPALQAAAEGTAELDLAIAGWWEEWGKDAAAGFPGPQVSGTAKLRNLRFTLRGTGSPVEILAADMQLGSDRVRVTKLSAKAAGASWTGLLEMPRGCGTPGACDLHFNLKADQIVLSELSEWASPPPKARPWYRVLEASPQAGPSFLASLRASGRLTTERFKLPHVEATDASMDVKLEERKLEVSDLMADLAGGQHRGEWLADFSVQPAVCTGSGRFSNVPLARLADTMDDAWITGVANAGYQVKGLCSTDFWHSAEASLQFDIRDGTLPHISLAEDEDPLAITRLSGQASLHGGELKMQNAVLNSPSGKFQLSGTASLQRDLDLKLARAAGATGYSITGKLAAPKVSPLPGTEQARLKR